MEHNHEYSGGEHSYKFSSANYLRLLASDNDIICKCAPRWLSIDELKNNDWSLSKNTTSELLEVWSKFADGVLKNLERSTDQSAI